MDIEDEGDGARNGEGRALRLVQLREEVRLKRKIYFWALKAKLKFGSWAPLSHPYHLASWVGRLIRVSSAHF